MIHDDCSVMCIAMKEIINTDLIIQPYTYASLQKKFPGGGGALNYTAVHTHDHRYFEPTLSKFYPLVKFIPYWSIFACFFDNFAP